MIGVIFNILIVSVIYLWILTMVAFLVYVTVNECFNSFREQPRGEFRILREEE